MLDDESKKLIEMAEENLKLMKETEEILDDINKINKALEGKEA